jgi:hypothetical protein
LAVTGKKIGGKTVGEHAKFITESKFYKETIRDLRVIVGEAMKSVGEAISEDVTEEDEKALKNVIQEEMKKDQKESEPIKQIQ